MNFVTLLKESKFPIGPIGPYPGPAFPSVVKVPVIPTMIFSSIIEVIILENMAITK